MQIVKYQKIVDVVPHVKIEEEMKKTVKPSFKVELDINDTVSDIYTKFGEAKQKAGLPMTDKELESIVAAATVCTKEYITPDMETIDLKDDEKLVIKKKHGKLQHKVMKRNIFKRFWYWIIK